MLEPRPFHIGSEVFEVGSEFPAYKVVFSFRDRCLLDWSVSSMHPVKDNENLVHASDGAPLGEFVPISDEAVRELADAGCGFEVIGLANLTRALNALIRGDNG